MNNKLIALGIFMLILISGVVYSYNSEKSSPSDRIKEDDIRVYKDRIVIDLKDAQWATFTDTNSMDPVFDAEANSLEIKPKSPEDIHAGDIVSYSSSTYNGIIIHRVISVSYDSQGWYAALKGDNNLFSDPEKVRFSQINGIVVAVIY